MINLAMHGAHASPGEGEANTEQPELPLLNQQAWTFQIDQENFKAVHDLTGFNCPQNIDADYTATTLAQYNLAGSDIGCNYIRSDSGAYMTFYMSWYLNPPSARELTEQNLSEVSTVKPLGKRLYESESTLRFGEAAGTCYEIDVELEQEDQALVTGFKQCRFGNWVFKTRTTYPPGDTGHDIAVASFLKQQEALSRYFSQCAAMPAQETSAGLLDEAGENQLSAVLATLSEEALRSESDDAAKEGPIGSIAINADDLQQNCVLVSIATPTTGYVFAQDARDKQLPYKVFTSSGSKRNQGLVVWVKSDPLLDNFYTENRAQDQVIHTLWGADKDGLQSLYLTYNSLPGHDQFVRDALKILNGEITAIASLSFTEGGGSNINLSLPTDEASNSQP